MFAGRQDAMNRHDVAGSTALYAADCVVESPTAGGVVQGHATVDAIHRAWVTGFPDVVFTTEDLLIDGEHVAWIANAAGTDTGGFMGLPPTGRAFALPMVTLSTLHDRRIVQERRVYDFTGMLVQIGILKAKATGSLAAPLARSAVPASESARRVIHQPLTAAATRIATSAALAIRGRGFTHSPLSKGPPERARSLPSEDTLGSLAQRPCGRCCPRETR